jgi:tRNA nucleotidyltransferase (CCA-adding enzyme)
MKITPQHHIDLFPNYEITTFRSDGAYQDHRRPEEVTWGKTLKEDVDRRDLTINALALKKLDNSSKKKNKGKSKEHTYEVIDYHNGIEDLKAEKIRTVGDPNLRFKEDALRILRAIRFSVQLNMEIDDDTYQAIGDHAHLIEHISWERIRDEFLKILGSEFPAEGVEILDETHLLEYIMPELLEGKGVKQSGHHITDVWTHSIDALRETPSIDPIVRLATLMHDIAKPRTYALKNGDITFYNHEIVGSRMASKIAKRLRLSKKNIQRIFILVRQHMFHYQQHNTDAAIRRFMRKVGLGNIDDILDLREGDRLGSGAKRTSWRLEEMKQRMIQQLNQPMEVKDLKIDGNDLMREFKLKPGRVLGEILKDLFEQVLEDPKLNTKETLFKLSKKYLETITV